MVGDVEFVVEIPGQPATPSPVAVTDMSRMCCNRE